MVTESWYAWLALRRRVSMSAIGSVIVMVVSFSLDVVSRRVARRDLERSGWGWSPSPAGLGHAGQLAAVSHLAQADPAEAELAVDGLGTPAALAAGVATDGELGLARRLHLQCSLRHGSVLLEREAELLQQRAPLLVVRRGGHDRDVHASRTVHAILVDLVEHDLLGETEGVVATAVELPGREAAEVAD